jgi:hypothetical protein
VLWGPGAEHVSGQGTFLNQSWAVSEGTTVLGFPVDCPGSTTQLDSAWVDAHDQRLRLHQLLHRIPDAQVAHHSLRTSAKGCKINHLLRATDFYRFQARVDTCHNPTIAALEDLAGFPLSPLQRLQAVLPIRSGGCGIKGASQMQPAARIAALAGFYGGDGRRVGTPDYAMAIDPGPLQSVLGDLLSRLGTNHDPLAT